MTQHPPLGVLLPTVLPRCVQPPAPERPQSVWHLLSCAPGAPSGRERSHLPDEGETGGPVGEPAKAPGPGQPFRRTVRGEGPRPWGQTPSGMRGPSGARELWSPKRSRPSPPRWTVAALGGQASSAFSPSRPPLAQTRQLSELRGISPSWDPPPTSLQDESPSGRAAHAQARWL